MIKPWEELTTQEKADTFPARHPAPVRFMLYLVYNVCPVPFPAMHKVLERMGWFPFDIETNIEMFGEKAVVKKGSWLLVEPQQEERDD